ncbi:fimbrial protein [Rahnella victoriana]|uniref:fimbrial protein n=1 Tax=Rahnella victoriana TaxID=1510570 RepID=UPI001E494B76|nr:fimbrial protein [Rahnella victoriana]UHM93645.1 fimbrial protein [Rahnella victoriana]
MLNRFFFIFVVTTGLVWTNMSFASCPSFLIDSTSEPWEVQFGDITVSADAPIGSTIASASATGPTLSLKYFVNCRMKFTTVYNGSDPALVNGMSHVYETNLAGVGFEVKTSNYPGTIYYENPGYEQTIDQVLTLSPGNVTVSFIKTGNIQPGVLTTYGLASFRGASPSDGIGKAIRLAGTSSIIGSACTVSNSTVNVNLGDFLTTEFSGIGYTTTKVAVPISLNCNTGTKISALVTADADSDSTAPGVFKLTSGTGSASGVAIQLMDSSGKPINLNEKVDIGTTTSDGEYDFNWTASYIQTKGQVIPGEANGSATLTFSYE